jgi:formylglycine-generating enzyme
MIKNYLILCFTLLTFGSFTRTSRPNLRLGKDRALLFAVNEYSAKNKLMPLEYPISDASKIKKQLEDKYDFECELVENPTLKQMEDKLSEYVEKYQTGVFDTTGQLFLYFTGHGERQGTNGFFLPSDVQIDNLKHSAFSYGLWRNDINLIRCKHIFIAIDACKSGSFDPTTETMRSAEDDNLFGNNGNDLSQVEVMIQDASDLKTRLFACSGAKDAKTPDKSVFADALLGALRTRGNIGNINDNVLTSKELSTFFEGLTPKPIGGKFGDNDRESNFFFIAKDYQTATTTAAPRQIETTTPTVSTPKAIVEKNSNMVRITSGSFAMGSETAENLKPVRTVTFAKSFKLSKHEVTYEEYAKYCEDEKIEKPVESSADGAKKPIVNVSWMDAIKYCNWLSKKEKLSPAYKITETGVEHLPDSKGYRLPTEAEWEYAANGGINNDKTRFSGSNESTEVAVTNEFSKFKLDQVGQHKPNSLGLFDMSGNVWEWVADCMDSYKNAPQDGSARLKDNCNERILRGGSYLLRNSSATVRFRYSANAKERRKDVGFRVAQSE